jgi:hypothetical protein
MTWFFALTGMVKHTDLTGQHQGCGHFLPMRAGRFFSAVSQNLPSFLP